MSAVNENLIRDVVSEVLGRLGGTATATARPAPAPAAPQAESCGCSVKKSSAAPALRGKFGVFATADEACAAAQEAFLQLQQKGIAARRKIEEIVKTLAEKNAEPWGKIEFEETKIGSLPHKVAKLGLIKLVPGVDWLRPDARSGDHGITLEEYTPFGVVGAITPSTHSIPTLSGNIVNICAAGNSVVFNAHPSAARCAAVAVRVRAARACQYARLGEGRVNARMGSGEVERLARPDAEGMALLETATRRFALSARSYHRILKVARTIADLEGQPGIGSRQVAEALQYRGDESIPV